MCFIPLTVHIIYNILNEEKGGWEINGDKIPGLLFADDLVLIATSEKELQ